MSGIRTQITSRAILISPEKVPSGGQKFECPMQIRMLIVINPRLTTSSSGVYGRWRGVVVKLHAKMWGIIPVSVGRKLYVEFGLLPDIQRIFYYPPT
jgi:hypothetical protein